MDSPDQSADLVSGGLIAAQIRANDLHGVFSIARCGQRFVGHSLVPHLDRQPTMPGQFEKAV